MELKSANGIQLTKALIYEWNNPEAPYSLREPNDGEYYVSNKGVKYKSLPYIYRHSVNEYDAALNIVGSWEHWKKLKGCDWFRTGLINSTQFTGLYDWQDEMELRDATEAKKLLMQSAKDGNVAAQRYLHEVSIKQQKAGRPAKKKPQASVKGEVSILADEIRKRKGG